jgi:hypothetical protein
MSEEAAERAPERRRLTGRLENGLRAILSDQERQTMEKTVQSLHIGKFELNANDLNRTSAREDYVLKFNLHMLVENRGQSPVNNVRVGIISLNRYLPHPREVPLGDYLLSIVDVYPPNKQQYSGDYVVAHNVAVSVRMEAFAVESLNARATYNALLAVYDRWYIPYDWKAAIYLTSEETPPIWYQLTLEVSSDLLTLVKDSKQLLSSESDFLQIEQISDRAPVVAWQGDKV